MRLTAQDVYFLIQENRGENTHIDFKKTFKDEGGNPYLVHDILCLANADYNGDRFLLFGVDDAANIVGIGADPNRKNREKIADMLGNAMINHPLIFDMYTVNLKGVEIDVLQIPNLSHKPYYLMKDYCEHNKTVVRCGVVYTRYGNKNTDRDGSAKEIEMDKMWRERFGLTQLPLQRMLNYIEGTSQWSRSEKPPLLDSMPVSSGLSEIIYYYNDFPEFTLHGIYETVRTHDFMEHWNKKQKNSPGSYQLNVIYISLKYHTTILRVIEWMWSVSYVLRHQNMLMLQTYMRILALL